MIRRSLFQEPVSAGGSGKESSEAQKDAGVFKAPPPPPKVTKCVTVPTDLYQDQVTALKCRKEHKEVAETPFTLSTRVSQPTCAVSSPGYFMLARVRRCFPAVYCRPAREALQ